MLLDVTYHPALCDYQYTWDQMKAFTLKRTASTSDQLWFVEHNPVYTLGLAGRNSHILDAGTIPVVRSDRGGQVTYHGPGQLMIYTLLDLSRLDLNANTLVDRLQNTVASYLTSIGIDATLQRDAPGVYVGDKKIASIGLRVKKGYCYHGMALNVDMDLTPFRHIEPCGFSGLDMTQVADFIATDCHHIAHGLLPFFKQQFGYQLTHTQPKVS